MHPLPKALLALFQTLPTAHLSRRLEQNGPSFGKEIEDRKLFESCLLKEFPDQINETRSHLSSYLQQIVQETDDLGPASDLSVDPFRLLYRFSQQHLHPDSQPLAVKYRRLLSWRFTTLPLGEDLPSTAFLAVQDYLRQHRRYFFTWSPTLPPHHLRLQRMFERGLVENHYHLYGSGPHFFLSWIHLMNFPNGRWKQFNRAGITKQRLQPDFQVAPNLFSKNLYDLVKLAALLRIYLFLVLHPHHNSKADDLWKKEISPFLNQGFGFNYPQITESRLTLLREEAFRLQGRAVIDYAIPMAIDPPLNTNDNLPYYGERSLMYRAFQNLFFSQGQLPCHFRNVFHLYLLIKQKFRNEMILANGRGGFDNFADFQDRKKKFLPKDGIWREIYERLCLHLNLQNPNIRSLEARLVPESNRLNLQQELFRINQIGQNFNWTEKTDYAPGKTFKVDPEVPFFFVAHFIKKPGKKYDIYRHESTRKAIYRQAKAIAQIRDSRHPTASLLYGIDAAGHEMNARPEVFAQAFRLLKHHKPARENRKIEISPSGRIPQLRATYHAGEDFLELADGLRMIHEAILFLQLGQGDRLGHALAMGQDVALFYKKRDSRFYLPRQVLIDNMAWMLMMLEELGYPDLPKVRPFLKQNFLVNFLLVYPEEQITNPLHTYQLAWKLRADNPEFYSKTHGIAEDPEWSHFDLDPKFLLKAFRKINEVKKLVYMYFFEDEIRKKGEQISEFKITRPYQKAIRFLQNQLMKMVTKKGIGIETNPTSNFLIGAFDRYDQHPIRRFYNRGLPSINDSAERIPQLFVSINTDDVGVFSTNLESEYALLALALEKITDEDGNPVFQPEDIYQYLENIRLMGFEMSFRPVNPSS